ncbi:hypothetical protein Anapl_04581 [Anas platyrhynchos]|uniref:Uncharacterized protein n=1 Tax=Anas platyrhynchos TaxID=8839 RepID=R0LDL1_ANAPL|nr:hypothetical protein Anapl_04581 [Anas platyrhynchos]
MHGSCITTAKAATSQSYAGLIDCTEPEMLAHLPEETRSSLLVQSQSKCSNSSRDILAGSKKHLTAKCTKTCKAQKEELNVHSTFQHVLFCNARMSKLFSVNLRTLRAPRFPSLGAGTSQPPLHAARSPFPCLAATCQRFLPQSLALNALDFCLLAARRKTAAGANDPSPETIFFSTWF